MAHELVTRAEFDARLTQLDQAVERHADRIVLRLDRLNGRVRQTETRTAVLEDRATQDLRIARQAGSRWGAGIAAVVSGALAYWLHGSR